MQSVVLISEQNAAVPEEHGALAAVVRGILLCGICIVVSVVPATAQSRTLFRVFENLQFSGNPPDFRLFGIEHLPIVDPHILGLDVPNGDQVRQGLALVGSDRHLVVDIEQWPVEGSNADTQVSLAKYQQTLKAFRRADPSVKLGLYSVLPVRDYWRAIGWRGSEELDAWKARNTEVAAALVPNVDELFPSLYTFYGDKDAWIVFAKANIDEARRISQGKPVYCFLWPQFHKTMAFLPGDFWYAQLDTCRRLADGVVIWGTMTGAAGYSPKKWDENAEWWQATLRFLREEGKIP